MIEQSEVLALEEDVPAKELIQDYVRRAMNETHGEPRAATALLRSWIRADEALAEAIAEQCIAEALAARTRHEVSIERSAIARVASRSVPEAYSRIDSDAAVSRAAHHLMSMRLPGSYKTLALALRCDVFDAGRSYESSRTAHGIRERFYKLVWQAATDETKPIKDQLTEERLQTLWKRAEAQEKKVR